MKIEYNIISIFDFFALIQGVLLGLILIFTSRKNRPSIFLGFFLITYSLELVETVLDDINFLQKYPKFLILPISFYFTSVPLLYLYSKNLVSSPLEKKHFRVLLPGLVEFLIFFVLFLQPAEKKQDIISNPEYILWYRLFVVSAIIYSIYFAWQIIRLVSNHQSKIVDAYTRSWQCSLTWVRYVAIYTLIFYITILILLGLSPLFSQEIGPLYYAIVSALNVFFIYWVGVSGLRQTSIKLDDVDFENLKKGSIRKRPLDQTEQLVIPKVDSSVNEKNSSLTTEEDIDAPFQRLKQLMEAKKLFKNPDLTLPILAKHFLISRHELSKLINENAGINFNRFVNEYRVEEAKKLLRNRAFDHLNMLGIAEEVGFRSKATFFSAFKQIQGTSPGKFKKQTKNI